MDLRDLKTFLHLAESRHFGRSARAMHVSPSTLSRQIQRLEEDLGQPLFVRDNRTVTLTEAGEELRTFAQQTLLQYQQLRHVIDQQGPSLSGELHIFCSVTAAYSHLPIPNASAPNAPWVAVWESPHTIVIPGRVTPCSGPMTWTMP